MTAATIAFGREKVAAARGFPIARAQALIRNHRLHHFKNEHYWYGVSMLAADRPLRTSPDPESVERSDTARTLGVAEAR